MCSAPQGWPLKANALPPSVITGPPDTVAKWTTGKQSTSWLLRAPPVMQGVHGAPQGWPLRAYNHPSGCDPYPQAGQASSGFRNSNRELTLLERGKGCSCRSLFRVVVCQVVYRLGDLEGSRSHQVELVRQALLPFKVSALLLGDPLLHSRCDGLPRCCRASGGPGGLIPLGRGGSAWEAFPLPLLDHGGMGREKHGGLGRQGSRKPHRIVRSAGQPP
jgi:hypothetical protein